MEAFSGKLHALHSSRPSTAATESLEVEFYSLLDACARLRNLKFAADYLEILKSCSSTVDRFSELARGRPLSADELKEKEMAEAALAGVKQRFKESVRERP